MTNVATAVTAAKLPTVADVRDARTVNETKQDDKHTERNYERAPGRGRKTIACTVVQ